MSRQKPRQALLVATQDVSEAGIRCGDKLTVWPGADGEAFLMRWLPVDVVAQAVLERPECFAVRYSDWGTERKRVFRSLRAALAAARSNARRALEGGRMKAVPITEHGP